MRRALGLTALLLLAASGSAHCQEPSIRPEWVADDERLRVEVSVREARITLGELLVQLSRQADVMLEPGSLDGSEDVAVCVVCNRAPLHRLLNAVWAAVSYRSARWEWRATGRAARARYQLVQPKEARDLRYALRRWVYERRLADATRLIQALDGTPQQRSQALIDLYGEPTARDSGALTPAQFWAGVASFRDALTPQERHDALACDQAVAAPFERIGGDTREFLITEWRHLTAGSTYQENGIAKQLPEPAIVTFVPAPHPSTRALALGVPGLPGLYLFGGVPLELAFRRYLDDRWILDGDSRTSPLGARVVGPFDLQDAPPPPAATARQRTPEAARRSRLQAADRRLLQTAVGSGVAIVARLPEVEAEPCDDPTGRTLSEFINSFWNKPWMAKWRDGVLVLSDRAWYLEDPPVPQWLVRRIRRDSRPGRFLPLETICLTARTITAVQITALTVEFPELAAVAAGREVLVFFSSGADLARAAQRPGGVRFTPEAGVGVRNLVPGALRRYLDSGEARQMELVVERHGPDIVAVSLRLRNGNGRLLAGAGFYNEKHPEQPVTQPHK